MEKGKTRDIRLDFVRIFAFLCVVSVHFFLKTGYYEDIMVGKKMFLMTVVRNFFMISVPLFITLTGYLMCNKELSKKYYKGIVKILVTYVLCSIVFLLFERFYLHSPSSVSGAIFEILAYRGTPYAWYVEMYIGLFIMIPFLNLISNNLKDKKQFKLLLFTSLFLFSLPSILNIYKFEGIDWWLNPASDWKYYKIFPSWWSAGYPILFYFLGAYIRKYSTESNIKLLPSLLCLILVVLLNGTFSYYRSYDAKVVLGTWNNYESFLNFIQTFLVFNLILKLNVQVKSKKVTYVIKKLSDSCFGAYLLSWIFDYLVYEKLCSVVPDARGRFNYFFVVLIVFTLSLFSSVLVERVRIILFYFSDKIYIKFKKA